MNRINPKVHLVKNWKEPEQVPNRKGYGQGLLEVGKKNKNVVALCADLTDSTQTALFKNAFPERFVEMGVAEQNLASVAGGMAKEGKIPFISSYGMFSPGRNWEQIRTTICYSNRNVKIIGCHTGISVGPDGGTHQAIEDIAITRAIPNLVVLSPCDYEEGRKAIHAAVKHKGPVYIRYLREKIPLITTTKTPFQIGKSEVYRKGKDVTIIATGQMVYYSLMAAEELGKDKIDVQVINCSSIKPLDKKTIVKAARDAGAIVTVEEHQMHGGLGGAIAELISQTNNVPMQIIGVRDRFGESGEPDQLLKHFKLTTVDIKKAVKRVLELKKGKHKGDVLEWLNQQFL